jgi:hypothetical protein
VQVCDDSIVVPLRLPAVLELAFSTSIIIAAALRLPAIYWDEFGGIGMTFISARGPTFDGPRVIYCTVLAALLALLHLLFLRKPMRCSRGHFVATALSMLVLLLGLVIAKSAYNTSLTPYGYSDPDLHIGPAALIAIVSGAGYAASGGYRLYRVISAGGIQPKTMGRL